MAIRQQESATLRILPPILTFKNSPTCIPSIGIIELHNLSGEELQVLSMESDNSAFHPALFKPLAVPAKGSSTVQVIYLPRVAGDAEATITVTTSAGESLYRTSATAVANAYRLHPFVGTKIPVGPPSLSFRPIESSCPSPFL